MTAGADSDGTIRIAYFDDQLLIREALVSALEETGVVVVSHSGTHGSEDLRDLLDAPVSVLLVALEAQTNDPMAMVRKARLVVPAVPLCALVAADRLARAREAIAAGCKGAVSTSAPLTVLVAALQALSGGQAYVDPLLGGRLIAGSVGKVRMAQGDRDESTRHLVAPAGEIAKS